jgi:hypothetical protein
LQEQLVTNLRVDLINAQRDWFTALSQLATATGLDPLEQALRLETIPDGTEPNAPGAQPNAPGAQPNAPGAQPNAP